MKTFNEDIIFIKNMYSNPQRKKQIDLLFDNKNCKFIIFKRFEIKEDYLNEKKLSQDKNL